MAVRKRKVYCLRCGKFMFDVPRRIIGVSVDICKYCLIRKQKPDDLSKYQVLDCCVVDYALNVVRLAVGDV